MGVSENSGTPKSSILIGFSIIHHPFWGTPTFGNTQKGDDERPRLCGDYNTWIRIPISKSGFQGMSYDFLITAHLCKVRAGPARLIGKVIFEDHWGDKCVRCQKPLWVRGRLPPRHMEESYVSLIRKYPPLRGMELLLMHGVEPRCFVLTKTQQGAPSPKWSISARSSWKGPQFLKRRLLQKIANSRVKSLNFVGSFGGLSLVREIGWYGYEQLLFWVGVPFSKTKQISSSHPFCWCSDVRNMETVFRPRQGRMRGTKTIQFLMPELQIWGFFLVGAFCWRSTSYQLDIG